MNQACLSFQHVTFRYDSMLEPLIHDLTLDFFRGWTGIVGVNGAGKTTLLKLATGLVRPQSGSITAYGAGPACGTGLYCEQRTDAGPELLPDFLVACDGEACRLRGLLGIGSDWCERWETLSHGERKRAQLGVALWGKPGLLAVDEPTNHLDAGTSAMVASALKDYTGIGLIVSHDRALLDELCRDCLFIDPPDWVLRPGGYAQGKEQEQREQAAARKLKAQTEQEKRRLEREWLRRRETARSKEKKLSKKGLDPRDHDARGKRNLARLSGKDGTGGKLQRQIDGRVKRLEEELTGIRYKKNTISGISLNGRRAERNYLFDLSPRTFQLGEKRSLSIPALQMKPEERIGVSGNNGSGKSTLIRYIITQIPLRPEELIYIPQEIELAESERLSARLTALGDNERGALMSAVSRLGSSPERLLTSRDFSPGEVRKLLLAFGLMTTPALIVMDEPTNHLDLLSIECLEEALVDSGCGLLLVSHDSRFLERLAPVRWEITEEAGQPGRMSLKIQAV